MLSKIYGSISELSTIVPEGQLATVRKGSGYSMYIFIGDKWMKYATAYDIGNKSEKHLKRLRKGSKGSFSTINLNSRPKSREIGSISGNITSSTGLFGDTSITLGGFGKVTSGDAKWYLINGRSAAFGISLTTTTVGNTIALPKATNFASHYKYIQYIAPYDMRVSGVSFLFGDTDGISGGARQYIGLFTAPSGITSTVSGTGAGTYTYTLKWLSTTGDTIGAGEGVQESDNDLGTDAFDLNAGDWVVLGALNNSWSGSTAANILAHVTLYCKVR